MMKLGVSTQIFWDYEELDLEYSLRHISEDLGFDCAEIHCQSPMFKSWGTPKDQGTKEGLKEILDSLDLKVTLHSPYHDLNMATLNLGVRKEVIHQITECLETANFLGSEIVVVHPGFLASRKYQKSKVFDLMVHNFARLAKTAEDLGVKLCMENLASKPKAFCVHVKEILQVFEAIDSSYLRLCLDVAHANTTGLGPEQFAEDLREYVSHVHISDNTGIDAHLPIGLGGIDFGAVLKALKPYDGCLMIEGWMPRNQDYFLRWDKKQLEDIIQKL